MKQRLMELVENIQELDQETRLHAGITLAIVLALLVTAVMLHKSAAKLEKRVLSRKQELAELIRLREPVLSMRKTIKTGGSDTYTAEDSLSALIERTGVKGRGIHIRPVTAETAKTAGSTYQLAELGIEAVTANELVNLLHQLSYGYQPQTIQKAVIRTRFNDPAHLDITLTIAQSISSQAAAR